MRGLCAGLTTINLETFKKKKKKRRNRYRVEFPRRVPSRRFPRFEPLFATTRSLMVEHGHHTLN